MKEIVLERKINNNLDSEDEDQYWDMVIKPRSSILDLQLSEIWRYRDLLIMFVKRDIVTVYKQTILGPIWFVIQPIMTTLIYLLIFNGVADIKTGEIPPILFYLSGIIIWNFFADSFNATSRTFKENENLFGKVYFPRLIMPLSKIFSGLIKFFIQFALLVSAYIYYYSFKGYNVLPSLNILYLPLFMLLMAGLGLGAGIIFTSLTTKYRDLLFVIQFGVQLLMYMTPIIYPASAVPEQYRSFLQLNPLAPIVEGFRWVLLGQGEFLLHNMIFSIVFTIVLLIGGVIIFNKTEKTFMDTV